MEIGHATESQLGGKSIQHLDGKQKAGSFNIRNGMSDGGVIGRSPSFRLHNSGIETVRLRRIFDTFDENKDGKISVEEFDRALQRLGVGVPADSSHMETMGSSSFRADGGGLEFEEFVDLHRSLGTQLWGDRVGSPSENEEEEDNDLKEAFRVFDEDGDGFICAAELQCVLNKLGLGEESEIERCERMICGVDENNDGLVDFSEFKHMMRNVIVRELKR